MHSLFIFPSPHAFSPLDAVDPITIQYYIHQRWSHNRRKRCLNQVTLTKTLHFECCALLQAYRGENLLHLDAFHDSSYLRLLQDLTSRAAWRKKHLPLWIQQIIFRTNFCKDSLLPYNEMPDSCSCGLAILQRQRNSKYCYEDAAWHAFKPHNYTF